MAQMVWLRENEMSDERDRDQAKRRDFLKLMGIGGIAGATALANGGPPTEAAEKAVSEIGYRETAHVRKFYETARF
jgi:hypothetical protein